MSRRKPHIPQYDLRFDKPEDFSLITETTLDADRLAREAAQRDADRAVSAKQQTEINLCLTPNHPNNLL